MIKRFCIVILMLICNIGLVQSQTYFSKRYPVTGGWGSVGFNALVNDSGYLSASVYISQSTGKQNFRILQTDFEGNVLFEKIYGDSTYSYGIGFQGSLQKVGSGGYVMYGAKQNINKLYNILYRFNDLGDTLWTKQIADTTYDYVGDNMKVTPDGGFICIGDRGSPSAPISVIKTDSLGNKQWEKFYGGTTYDKPTSIAVCNDGGYIYCTTTKSGGVGLPNYNIRVMKIDSLGNMVFNKFYGGLYNEDAGEIIQTQDGGYVIACSYAISTSIIYPTLIKLNSIGDTLWLKKIIPFTGSGDGSFESVLELNDGSLVAAGLNWFTDSVTFGRDRGLVAKITATGDLVWQREHDLSTCNNCSSYLYDIRTTSDGGFICSGVAQSPQDMWLLKLDSLGCADTACALATAVEEVEWEVPFGDLGAFNLYPNPNQGTFTLLYSTQEKESSYLSIIDFTGRTVYQQTLSAKQQGKETINMTHLPTGIYFVRISGVEGELLYTNKLSIVK